MSKILNFKTCAFFDLVDFEEDKEFFENVISSLNQELETHINNIIVTSYVDEIENVAPNCDICFIDFGGLDYGGASLLLDSTIRSFEKLIKENENKFFIFILSMPLEFYLNEDILKNPNVIKADRRNLKECIKQILKKFDIG